MIDLNIVFRRKIEKFVSNEFCIILYNAFTATVYIYIERFLTPQTLKLSTTQQFSFLPVFYSRYIGQKMENDVSNEFYTMLPLTTYQIYIWIAHPSTTYQFSFSSIHVTLHWSEKLNILCLMSLYNAFTARDYIYRYFSPRRD